MTSTDRPDAGGRERARIPPYLTTPLWPGRPRPSPAGDPAGSASRDPAGDPAARAGPGPDRPAIRPRPFVLTAGRVQSPDPEIGLETQVTTRSSPPPWAAPVSSLAPELQLIVAMCAQPTSVAEISAQVPLHLGVARVLVSDLRATGHLDVHALDVANPHDPDLILRVIRGLRAIS